MRLSEALQIIGQNSGERERRVRLLCGFTPLHFLTLLKAHLRLRFPGDAVQVSTGLFGDLEGNLQRAAIENEADGSNFEGSLGVIEWSDLDPRLGWRNSGGWSAGMFPDILGQVEEKCLRLEAQLRKLAQGMPVSVAAPSLPLPPFSFLPVAQTDPFELRLNGILLAFLERVCDGGGVRIINASALARISPYAARHDVKMDIQTGFPYSLAHADALAQIAVGCLFPAVPKKGLITDLDQTLWKGILGDDGVDGMSWSLEENSQIHALYQQLLAALAESGVLIAIASKNDLQLVKAALQRPDILIKPAQIFPVEAGWGAKSEAVGRILKAWNIGVDSVVFVDDSPMELAEVSEKYPGAECLQFPSNDPAAAVALLWQIRAHFGKETIAQEDRLRLPSLRQAAEFKKDSPLEASADFMSRLRAKITFEEVVADHSQAQLLRAYELVNKTNQFNLNGLRYTEAEWKSRLVRPSAFLTVVSYEDRFGPLGRIAVIGGWIEDGVCSVDIWVMSCRAFSRHIEFQTVRQLLARSGVRKIRLFFQPTEHNSPLQTFLGRFFPLELLGKGEINLSAQTFEKSCPPLFHEVIEL